MSTNTHSIHKQSSMKHKVLHLALGAALVGSMFTGASVSAETQNDDINVDTEWLGAGEGVDFDVHLYNDTQTDSVGTATLDSENEWKHTFTDREMVIPVEEGADIPITYSLKSTPMTDYYSVVTGNQSQGFTVLNMLKSEGEIQGQIIVRYVDEQGAEIAYRTIQTGRVNSDYAEIMPKNITGYKEPVVTRGETTGNYEYGINIVEFTYEQADPQEAVQGAIEVYHVDRFGNEIALRNMVSGEVDQVYEIEPQEITGYNLVTDFTIDEEEENEPRHQFYLDNSDNVFGATLNGQYEEGIHKVYFMYDVADDFNPDAPVRGGVIVKFVDTDGNEIVERHVDFGFTDGYDIDGEYISAQRFDVGINWLENHIKNYLGEPDAENIRELGYGVVGVDNITVGSYVAGFTEITYTLDVIKNDPGYENFNDVLVQHMDEFGNEIAVRDRVFAEIGTEYNVNEKQINGYTFDRVIGETTGTITDQTVIVQFIYTKADLEQIVVDGEVIVRHVDSAGNEIADSVEQKGEVGTAYTTEAVTVEGYEFVQVRGNANGVFGEGVLTIDYVYQLIEQENEDDENNQDQDEDDVIEFSVIATYVDTNGNEIADREVHTGARGAGYTTIQKGIDGYEFVEVIGTAQGLHIEDGRSVVYVYQSISGDQNEDENLNEDEEEVNQDEENNNNNDDEVTNQDGNNNSNNNNNGNVNDDNQDVDDNPTHIDNNAIDNTSNPTDNNENINETDDGSELLARATQDESDDDVVKGERLADTATNTFNMIAVGLGLLVLAGGGLFFVNRRRNVTDSE